MPAIEEPRPEMLWESCDPQEALADRFGFADGGEATDWLTRVLAEHWGVRVVGCERIVISDRNALAWLVTDAVPDNSIAKAGRLLAKWSVEPRVYPFLAESSRLTAWLGDRGLPVAAPYRSLGGTVQVEMDGVSIGLQPVVEDDLLDVADAEQVRAAGTTLAHLHTALADASVPDRLGDSAGPFDLEPLRERIARWVKENGREELPAARVLLDHLPGLPGCRSMPAHVVHNDFRSANVLSNGTRITAVLDFEEISYDYRVVDLAHAGVVLGTRYRLWQPISDETRQTLVEGYRSAFPLSPAEEAWLTPLLLWRTLRYVPNGEDRTTWHESAERLAAAL